MIRFICTCDVVNKSILSLFMILISGMLMACTSVTQHKKEANQKQEIQEHTEGIDHHIQAEWDLTPSFEHPITYEGGREGSYTIIGNQHTVGFTGPFPLEAGKGNKYMWFYFGDEQIYDQPVKIKAIKKDTEKLITLHSGSFFQGAEVSPDSVNMPSILKFPSAGRWKILVYIDGELFERLVVDVE
ncbi:MAG: hypothetical protein H0Z32_01300 [Bacillaceae bacterium]|nr:hypothetical protein [Bacillaceae bacterium]